MKKIIELSLQEELERETEEIKKELERHPELAQIEVSKEKDDEFFERARALEAELKEERLNEETMEMEGADKEASEKRRPNEETPEEAVPSSSKSTIFSVNANGARVEPVVVYHRRRKKKTMLVALVAVLVLVMGLSMTSVGSKSYLKQLLDKLYGGESIKTMNVEDMDVMSSEDGDEATAYNKIGEELGIYVVKIKERPENMVLMEVQIEKALMQAKLFYQYGGEVIRYTIYLNDKDSSWGELEEDEKVKEYEITVNDVIISVKEYEVENHEIYRRVAEFTYRGVSYQLKGIMEREEFEKILKNLHFF